MLDDYAVHLMESVRKALLKRGYILVVIGGGVTGDCQINDTHLHAPLKAKYREQEMALMLEKLRKFPKKVPSPTNSEMIEMIYEALDQVSFDKERAFKSLFLTNSLDGKEDHLVSDKLFPLIGPKIQEFRSNLMKENCPNTLEKLVKTITPPKGIKRKNTEGSELFDCTGNELDLSEQSKELTELLTQTDPDAEMEMANSRVPKVARVEATPVKISKMAPLGNLCNNAEVNADSKVWIL